jgi:Mrp family chromosome partitioning ATPase
VLPAGITVSNPHAVLASERLQVTLLDVRGRADMVLLDTPALGPVSDAVDLAPNVDSCVLVVRLKQTTKEGARRALRTLTEVGVDIAGVVVTGAEHPSGPGKDYYVKSDQPPRPAKAEEKRSVLSALLGRRRKRAAVPSME